MTRYRSLESPETLRKFVHNLREGIYITKRGGELLDANPAMLEIFGVDSVEELRSYSAIELFVDPSLRKKEMALLDRKGAVREYEFQVKRPDGGIRTVLDTCYLVEDETTGEMICHGILVDITQRKELEEQLREYSIRDPLTGCYNRRYLDLVQAQLDGDGGIWGAIVVDIDHFKDYNDLHGHQAGDEVLVKVSRFLMRHVRAEDPVVRIGGDEFLTLLLGEWGNFTAEAAKRIHSVLEGQAPVPLSFGWALREGGETLEETIGRADHSLIRLRIEQRGDKRWEAVRRTPH
ncbi:MAG: sensor domain-containing diguanylate cyclase [Acidobacteriota bacterium]